MPGLFILVWNLQYICGMAWHFLFISGAEIFFIMFIVVMVFGADKIPGIAKGLGKGMRQLNGVYTRASSRRHGRSGHLFQGRYKAILAGLD